MRSLEPTPWSVFQPILTSSYQGWGTGGLDRDVREMARLVHYVREYKSTESSSSSSSSSPAKIVLMGHSTGSQDVLHYLSCGNSPADELERRTAIDGAILQAPVSDRQAIQLILKSGFGDTSAGELRAIYARLEALAKASAAQQGQKDDDTATTILPVALTSKLGYPAGTAVSARRFLSLVSPDSPDSPGQDDMFSSDLPDARLAETFGMIEARGLLKQGKLLVLMSGADQSVPAHVDKDDVLRRWRLATDVDGNECWDVQNSGVVAGASHALSNDDQAGPRQDLSERVARFLTALA